MLIESYTGKDGVEYDLTTLEGRRAFDVLIHQRLGFGWGFFTLDEEAGPIGTWALTKHGKRQPYGGFTSGVAGDSQSVLFHRVMFSVPRYSADDIQANTLKHPGWCVIHEHAGTFHVRFRGFHAPGYPPTWEVTAETTSYALSRAVAWVLVDDLRLEALANGSATPVADSEDADNVG